MKKERQDRERLDKVLEWGKYAKKSLTQTLDIKHVGWSLKMWRRGRGR
jgi:hypothetical protein